MKIESLISGVDRQNTEKLWLNKYDPFSMTAFTFWQSHFMLGFFSFVYFLLIH
jgi:hypothetical protein